MRFLLIKYPTDYSVENFNILVNITKPPFILHRKMNLFSFFLINSPLPSFTLHSFFIPRSQRGPCLGPVRDPAWPPLSVPPVLRSSHACLFLLHRKIFPKAHFEVASGNDSIDQPSYRVAPKNCIYRENLI